MTNYRVEISHWFAGAVPKDYYVNVIYITATGDPEAFASDMRDIWFGASGGFVVYAGFHGQVRLYDMAAAKPRPVAGSATYTPTTPADPTTYLPDQVALCLSFYATRNLKSQRGRVYIGPFYNDGTSDDNGPSTAAVTQLLTLAAALAGSGGHGHDVYSPKLGLYQPVTNYWVDNRWDTQRRRLSAATNRRTYP